MKLFVMGDPIVDKYVYGAFKGNRFVRRWSETKQGGVFITYNNAQTLSFLLAHPVEVIPLWQAEELLTLVRYEANELVMEMYEQAGDLTNFYSKPVSQDNPERIWDFHETMNQCLAPVHRDNTPCAIVYSDYNKGTVNRQTPYSLHLERLEPLFVVVDTRHRSFDLDLIPSAPCVSIWRCTGDEYDFRYAENFDFSVHTNHGGPIHIRIAGRRAPEITLIPPKIEDEVRDTCGLGDAFTGIFAAKLAELTLHTKRSDTANIEQAAGLAARHCSYLARTRERTTGPLPRG